MSLPSEKDRVKKFISATSAVAALYADPESGRLMYEVFTKHKLNEETYSMYADAVGDVILGFYTVEELPRLLVQQVGLDQVTALKVTSELLDFLSPIIGNTSNIAESTHSPSSFTGPETTSEITPESPQEIETQHTVEVQPQEQQVPVQNEKLEAKPPVTSEVSINPNVIEPIHTMQSDIDFIREQKENPTVGYKSRQVDEDYETANSSVPRYKKPLTEAPKYDNTNPSSGHPR